MDRLTLANRINSISTIKGQFRLRSRQISNEYFDKYLFESPPDLLRAIAEQMATQSLHFKNHVSCEFEFSFEPNFFTGINHHDPAVADATLSLFFQSIACVSVLVGDGS
jgi:hypothetical protein